MHRTPDPEGQQGPTLLESALELLRRGWSIIPIAVGTKKPPRKFRWKQYQSQPPDEGQLKRWFAKGKYQSFGVIHGAVSGGLVCRDFDDMESYETWAREHPDLANTLPTVATARGRHVYFRGPEMYAKLPDGELIGDAGHYSVLPPSRHPDGPLYRWLIPLPDGPLPFIDDLHAAGLLPKNVTQKAQNSQKAQKAQEGTRRHKKAQEGTSGWGGGG